MHHKVSARYPDTCHNRQPSSVSATFADVCMYLFHVDLLVPVTALPLLLRLTTPDTTAGGMTNIELGTLEYIEALQALVSVTEPNEKFGRFTVDPLSSPA
jgi:hypothetical protein